jgi:rhodanese-related sulfurtransferase
MIKNLSPQELKSIMDSGEQFRLIDVREQWEFEIAKLDNSELLPLSNFINLSSSLNPEEKLIIYCHHGTRSYNACQYLAKKGFSNLFNLNGGINAWSKEIDSNVPQY